MTKALSQFKCFGILCRQAIYGQMSLYLQRLSMLASSPITLNDSLRAVRLDVSLRADLQAAGGNVLLPEAPEMGEIPLIDTSLFACDVGLLRVVPVPIVVQLIGALLVYDRNEPPFATQIVLQSRNRAASAHCAVQLQALLEPLMNFMGPVVPLATTVELARSIGVRAPMIACATPQQMTDLGAELLREIARNTAEVAELLAGVTLVDIDARSITLPTGCENLLTFPGADTLITDLSTLVSNSSSDDSHLVWTRRAHFAVLRCLHRLVFEQMQVARYTDGGTWNADLYLKNEFGLFSTHKEFRLVFCIDFVLCACSVGDRRAFAKSATFVDTFHARWFVAPLLHDAIVQLDDLRVTRIWQRCDAHAKSQLFAVAMRGDRMPLAALIFDSIRDDNDQV
jgi:hypothetical protein